MIIKIKAYAKLNLALDILGKLPNGYHELNMIMQSISLHDDIEIAINDGNGIVITTDNDELQNDDENIAKKAAELFLNHLNLQKQIEIFINKKIPVSGGMGGGSTDAAAVLCSLNHAFGDKLSMAELRGMGMSLGADVPFCMQGGTVLATGVGERLKTLVNFPKCFFVLAKACHKPSTAEIYKIIDKKNIENHPNIEMCEKAIQSNDLKLACRYMDNVFINAWQDSTMDNIRLSMLSHGAIAASLSGAGPTQFAVFDSHMEAHKCAELFNSKGIWSTVVTPVERGYAIV
ncbi:MAG: 4-(cytidine 5'-diphospho)-2-C-methyl-D-erythritol kinase [Oscillospiraceae bacterium]